MRVPRSQRLSRFFLSPPAPELRSVPEHPPRTFGVESRICLRRQRREGLCESARGLRGALRARLLGSVSQTGVAALSAWRCRNGGRRQERGGNFSRASGVVLVGL